MSARSYLFVPGDRPAMLAKAAHRGADALIVDLEDAVAPSSKAAARAITAAWLSGLAGPRPPVWVRVNNVAGILEDDVAAVLHPRLRGLMIPKVDGVADLESIALRLDDAEAAAGVASGAIRLLPIIETARGVLGVSAIAAAPRVERLMIGELDLGADLGVDATDEVALVPLRLQVVVASAAAGIAPPLGPVAPDYRDLEALADDTRRLFRQGFRSRPAIHPSQVPIYNDVFTPSTAEVARARRLVELYETAHAAGRGAVVDEDGRMVDEAVVKAARRIIETAAGVAGA
jgi:citrate lyase subunit beta/citryl-CoA lyase